MTMDWKRLFESMAQSLPIPPEEEAAVGLLGQYDEKNITPERFERNPKSTSWKHLGSHFVFWLPWVLAMAFASLSVRLWLGNAADRAWGSYTSGWVTDMASARPALELQYFNFSGSAIPTDGRPLRDDELLMERHTPASDELWHRMLGGQYFLITEEEARQAWGQNGQDIEEYWDPSHGGYRASVDVLHTLHCVDYFRKLNSTIMLQVERGEHVPVAHHLHCFGQVRQSIMCNADMTPVPSLFGRGYPDQSYPHTCRNFSKIREWIWERFNGSSAVQPDWTRRV